MTRAQRTSERGTSPRFRMCISPRFRPFPETGACGPVPKPAPTLPCGSPRRWKQVPEVLLRVWEGGAAREFGGGVVWLFGLDSWSLGVQYSHRKRLKRRHIHQVLRVLLQDVHSAPEEGAGLVTPHGSPRSGCLFEIEGLGRGPEGLPTHGGVIRLPTPP